MTRSADWAIPKFEKEIAENVADMPEEKPQGPPNHEVKEGQQPPKPKEKDDEQMVEVDLDTGEVNLIETPPVSLFFRILRKVGEGIATFAEQQGKPADDFKDAIEKYTRKLTVLKVAFWVSLLAGCVAAEMVFPYLGVLLFTLYLIYLMLINVSGTTIAIDRLRQMAVAQAASEMGLQPGMMPFGQLGKKVVPDEFGNYL